LHEDIENLAILRSMVRSRASAKRRVTGPSNTVAKPVRALSRKTPKIAAR
jgi:hypothetical protein